MGKNSKFINSANYSSKSEVILKYVGEIIILWSKKQTISFISIGDLWRALTKIERHDVQQHLLDQVNQDIQRYQRLIGAANISLEDQLEITRTRRDILTLEDITSVHEGKSLELKHIFILIFICSVEAICFSDRNSKEKFFKNSAALCQSSS